MSLPIGSKVSDCTSGGQSSMFCEDSSCVYNSAARIGKCISPFVSISNKENCVSYKDCIGESKVSDGTVYTKSTSCQCGMNENATSYCSPQDGDLPAVNFRKAFRAFIEIGSLNRCNTEERFETNCINLSAGSWWYKRLMAAYYKYYYYPQLVAIDSCIDDIFFPQLNHALGIVVSLIGISLFF
jgi:hypothetical protein